MGGVNTIGPCQKRFKKKVKQGHERSIGSKTVNKAKTGRKRLKTSKNSNKTVKTVMV